MMEQNGTAVDAAIAASICNGVHSPQSMGISSGKTIREIINKGVSFF
jgi:gamma-glutamyltranspeptidase